MNFFISFTLCHALLTLLYPLPCVIKNIKMSDEKNEDFFYIYGCFSISHNIKRGRKIVLKTIAFLDTHVCVNNPY